MIASGIDPGLCHLANSAAIIDLPKAHLDLVRAGIMLYGLQAFGRGAIWQRVDLRPALSLRTRVAFVKRVPPGPGISYGHIYRTDRPRRPSPRCPSATPTAGPGCFPARRRRLIGGRRYPIVGRICMDQCLVDLGDDETEVGAEAVLIGRQGGQEIERR